VAKDIRTRLIADDDMSPAFREAGRAATRMALDVEGATLKVERATKAAAAAEQRFGKESTQAREAAHRLAVADLELAAANDRVKDAAEKSSKTVDKGNGALRGMAMTLGRLGASAATTAALAGPLVTGLLAVGHAAVLAAREVATVGRTALAAAKAMAPAAAALPAFAAGFELVRGTIQLASPAIMAALHPIAEAFLGTPGTVGGKKTLIGGLREDVGELASKGLPRLAQGFLRVNFPMIGSAMKGIAMQLNSVLVRIGRWINSSAGQRAIFTILQGTLQVTRKLSEVLPGVVISFGNMVGRAAGPGFKAINGLGPMLDRAATAAKHLFDTTSSADVAGGFKTIGSTFGRVKGAIEGVWSKLSAFGHLVLDVGNWMNDNQGKVKAFSDVLAGVGIALGIWAGGGPIGIVIGVLTLLANHWDLVKDAVSGAVGWFRTSAGVADVTGTAMGVFRGIVADLSSWFSDRLMPSLREAGSNLMPHLRDAVAKMSQAFHDNRDIIAKVQGVLAAVGVILTQVVIPVVGFLAGILIDQLAANFKVVVTVINRVVLPAFRIMTHIILDQFGAIIHGASAMLGWVPGIGPKLKAAAAAFDRFRDQVNGALGGIKDQHVTVGATIKFSTGPGSASAGLKVAARKDGGMVAGPGGPRDDDVLLAASAGEFVVNAKETGRHRSTLEAINAGRYRDGGLVVSTSTGGLAQTMAAERKALLATAKRMAPSLTTGPVGHVGGGVRQWAGLVTQVLAELGQPASALGPVLSRMQRESGGNPHAINLWDSNAQHGDPSRGLMQTIGSTFAAFAGPYRGAGIWDPHANIYAGINYAMHRYGAGWIRQMTAGGGYDQGGVATGAGWMAKRTSRPERVLSPAQTVSFDRLTRVLASGGNGGTTHVTVEVTASAAAIEDRIVEATRSAVRKGRLSTTVIPAGTRA
jgi:hypothetical protein